MEQYISKATLVAEIERLHKEWRWYSSTEAKYRCEVYRELSEFLDTIEVKELPINHDERFTTITDIAKFCFEHGLKAKDVNEIIKTAEDHAYFAGSENTREKLVDKACEWLSQTDFCRYYNKEFIDVFRKAMEE